MGNNNQQPLNVAEFLGSKYLAVADVSGPQVVTIVDAFIEEFDDGNRAVALCFEELDKSFTLNKTNLQTLVQIFQTADASQWRGPIGLYVDPNVTNSRQQRVGGVRVTPSENIRPQRANGPAGQPRYKGDPEEHIDGMMNY